MAINFIIWFIGAVAAYLALKKSFRIFYGEWTLAGRIFCLFLCLFSWIGFMAAIIEIIIVKLVDKYSDEPASW